MRSTTFHLKHDGARRDTCHASHRARRRAAFTLIEVMVAMLLMAIVLPALGKGISIATRAASTARHRNEASGLAEGKLAQIIADGTWLNGATEGDFGTDWPGYTWKAEVSPWIEDTSDESVQQIDLKVSWNGNADSITISTLAYDRSQVQ